MKIGLLTIGSFEAASTWYRIGQYIPFLKAKGWQVDPFEMDKIKSYDVVVVQKVLLSAGKAKRILREARKVVFDFDDAIWTRPGKDFNLLTRFRVGCRLGVWLKGAHRVIVPNQVLRKKALEYRDEVDLLPMAIDLSQYPEREGLSPEVLGWSGAPHNLHYLEEIIPLLKHSSYPLAVYSGAKPSFVCRHTPFAQGGEAVFLKDVGIGLLPLPNDLYARGKSPIKALQYMASGIPFIASGSGGVEELLDSAFGFHARSEKEWIDHLERLRDPEIRKKAGIAARAYALRHHDVKVLQEKLSAILDIERSEI